jgi:hypothetical protein
LGEQYAAVIEESRVRGLECTQCLSLYYIHVLYFDALLPTAWATPQQTGTGSSAGSKVQFGYGVALGAGVAFIGAVSGAALVL